jgi:dTDP-4-dehydrorhamnose reductase
MSGQEGKGVRVLITGLSGTLAPHVANRFQQAGHEIVAWDRGQLDPNAADGDIIVRHIEALKVDGIVHVGMGAEAWAAAMARHMGERGLPFVFTSTALVFDEKPNGPHHIQDERSARDDYGRYKIRCEDAILAANPSAVIARFGYQIDETTRTGNNMVAHLFAQAEAGPIRASQSWVPATSFMADTARGLEALFTLAQRGQASGVHHLDSNIRTALTYPEIVARIATRLNQNWVIERTDDYVHDQRLIPVDRDDTVILPDLFVAES